MPWAAAVDVGDLVSDSQVSGWDIALAVITLVLAWILGRIVMRTMIRLLGRVDGVSEDLRQSAGRIAKYFVWVIGLGVALGFLGAEVQPLLTAALVIAVVAALALRGVAENFAAGVVIQTGHPLQLGDYIQSLGHEGTVVETNGRAVIIETTDRTLVHLPNSEVLANPIVNNSVHGRHRSEIEVRTPPTDDLAATLDAISGAVAGVPGVDREPAADVLVRTVEPSRVVIRVRVWHDPAQRAIASAVIRAIADALRALGIDAAVVSPPPPPVAPLASPI
jgi:small-conductance mechanosensitive channel